MVAFIPGRAKSGDFIQLISREGARQFQVSDLTVRNGMIQADRCWFSSQGCHIELPASAVRSCTDRLRRSVPISWGHSVFFPMECRHGVLSMAHTLQGSVRMDGYVHSFEGGLGYVEKDSGTSFPRSYLWMQCNDFPSACSIMISIAHIPFFAEVPSADASARSCTKAGSIVWQPTEASKFKHLPGTYLSVSRQPPAGVGYNIPTYGPPSFVRHSAERCPAPFGESCNVHLRARLWERGKAIFSFKATMPPMNLYQIMGRKRKDILFSF